MRGGTNGRATELRFSKQNLSKSVRKIKILRVEKLWSFRLKTKESTETSWENKLVWGSVSDPTSQKKIYLGYFDPFWVFLTPKNDIGPIDLQPSGFLLSLKKLCWMFTREITYISYALHVRPPPEEQVILESSYPGNCATWAPGNSLTPACHGPSDWESVSCEFIWIFILKKMCQNGLLSKTLFNYSVCQAPEYMSKWTFALSYFILLFIVNHWHAWFAFCS